MSYDAVETWSAFDVQNLYDVFVKYVDPLDTSLKRCIVCLCVANPYERLLQMQCCKATTLHFSCWFDSPRGLCRTIGDVNRDVETSEKIPLKRSCPTCQQQNAHAVEVKDHFETASKIHVVCKVCEEKYTFVNWFPHWRACGGAFVRLHHEADVEACVAERRISPCDSRFWQLSLKTRQILAIVFILLVLFTLIASIIHG
jgi:hypothetical protein